MLRLYLLCLAFFVGGLDDWAGESFDFFVGNVGNVGNCARHRRLIAGLFG